MKVEIVKINNGYLVTAPRNPGELKKEEAFEKNASFIPEIKHVHFFTTLEEVHKFLQSIEKNVPASGRPRMHGLPYDIADEL